jgi:hypothetical protein
MHIQLALVALIPVVTAASFGVAFVAFLNNRSNLEYYKNHGIAPQIDACSTRMRRSVFGALGILAAGMATEGALVLGANALSIVALGGAAFFLGSLTARFTVGALLEPHKE